MENKEQLLGRYRILREIGRGASGTVFEAYDGFGGNRVAIKILRQDLQGNPVAKERFLREVEAANRVDHPVIITIHGWGEEAGSTYIAMEYVDGQPLSKFLSPIAPFPLEQTVRIVRQVAEGLACVHRAGLVHRDIKPDNIMLLKNGAVKLSDFGVAKLPDSSLTQAGELWGSLQYMSPEQVQGKLDLDGQSDIFSLGAVLFEMLTCRRPFDGDGLGVALMRRIVEDPVPRVTTLRAEIPGAFDAIVARALAKKPAERYRSCDEFAEDLGRVMPSLRPRNGAALASA
jgi:serine/threonine-protein kinase